MALLDSATQSRGWYRDGLRGWIDEVQRMGELLHVNGAHWDAEMGSITQMLTESSNNTAPAILFDEIPGYAKGFRTLYGHFSTVKRVALTLGLPLQNDRKVDIVQRFHKRMQDMKAIPPRFVKDGPVLQNVLEGDKIDVLKFPVPRHHEKDTARYIGTACCVITQDPDEGWYNLGAYRSQVYDRNTVGCQITEGKHGRIHRDKNFERGQPMKVAIVCGQDPLLFMLSGSPMPDVSEYDLAGGLRGEPVDVVRGPYTGFPIPADAEHLGHARGVERTPDLRRAGDTLEQAGFVDRLVLRRAAQDRIVAVEDGFHVDVRPRLRVVGVVAHPFAERALRPDLAGHGLALQHDLGVSRNRETGVRPADHVDRLAAQAACDVEFADLRQRR